jgi:hypothetical protein
MAERAEIGRIVHEGLARLAGIDAELAALSRPGTATGIRSAPRTEAIIEVLRRSSSPMSPKQIRTALEGEGRNDSLRSITATLNHLMGTKTAVVRVGRGQYQLIG